jgi:hypothetical protein
MWQFRNLWIIMAIMLLGGSCPHNLAAQTAPAQGMGEHPCPLCGQPWRGKADPEVTIPEKMPVPKNQEWLSKLRQGLMMAKHARAQDEADQRKFGITNPYRYIIPQIDHHIGLISKLFAIYGLPADGKPSAIRPSSTVLQSLEKGKRLAADSVTQYEWLLNHAEDKNTNKVLNSILTQTKLHYIMFDNVIRLFKIEGTMAPLLL